MVSVLKVILRGQRPKKFQFQTILGYRVRYCLAGETTHNIYITLPILRIKEVHQIFRIKMGFLHRWF